ncbi:MAG TPA: retropepsin-like aspartic protease [Nostocaceae cyanobacterium]|nr:retropepsin-like aspartic protease [Nostocaceae cyanobacterium]
MFSSTSTRVQNSHQRRNKLFGVLLTSIFLASISSFLPTPALGQTNRQTLGRQLLQTFIRCVEKKIPNPNIANETQLQNAATDCIAKEILLDSNGKLRPDANDRVAALIEVSGAKLPQRIAKGKANITLSYLAENQIYTIPVSIGNTNKTFLLDTGSGQTIVNSQLARQLGLKSVAVPPGLLQQKPVIGGNLSQVPASVFTLPTLSVSAASVTNLYVLGLPSASIPDNLAGVLGLDFLSHFDLIINPQNRQLQLLPPSQPVSGAIPLRGNFGILTAQVYINNQGPFNFIVDTGATSMIISKDLAQKLRIDLNMAEREEILGFGGTENAKKITLAKIQLQQHQATKLEAYILENSPILTLPGIQGIIGQNFLNQYRQHWRFGKRNSLGLIESGTLVLTPL